MENFENWVANELIAIRQLKVDLSLNEKKLKDLKKAKSRAIEKGEDTIQLTKDIRLMKLQTRVQRKQIRIIMTNVIKAIIKM